MEKLIRQVKFRGISDDGYWVYGYVINTGATEECFCISPIQFADRKQEGTRLTRVMAQTISEWTGMIDCEGNEVYEGDIVRSFNPVIDGCEWDDLPEYDIVVYCLEEKMPCFNGKKRSINYPVDENMFLNNETIKVIGNIYQHIEWAKKVMEDDDCWILQNADPDLMINPKDNGPLVVRKQRISTII